MGTGFGVGVLRDRGPAVLGGHLPADLGEGAVYLVSVGVGVLLCAVAERGGFAVSLAGAGAAVVLSGAFFLVQRRFGGIWAEPLPYAALLGAWGLWELRPGRG